LDGRPQADREIVHMHGEIQCPARSGRITP
jgi:hypothetical protein